MSDDSNEMINLDNVQNSGRPFLRNGMYSIRCLACEKGRSKKGNEMFTMQYEIVAPATVKTPNDNGSDVEVPIAGLKLTDWIVFNDMGFAKLKGLHKSMQLSMIFNKKNPDTRQYIGKAVKVSLTTEPQVLKDENTGEPILDDSGQPTTLNNYRLQRFIGPDMEHTLPADSINSPF